MDKKKLQCKDCIYLDLTDRHSVGYACTSPEKRFRTRVASYKQPTAPACVKCFKGFDGRSNLKRITNWDVLKHSPVEAIARLITCPYNDEALMRCQIEKNPDMDCNECCLEWLNREARK